MLYNLLNSTPYITLILGMVHLFILYLYHEDRAKIYSRVARFWLIFALFFAIVFYAQVPFSHFFKGDAYTLLFILIISMLVYHIFGLSVSWFSALNRTGCRFYILLLCIVFCSSLFVCADNLLSLFGGYVLINFIGYKLYDNNYEKKTITTSYNILWWLILALFGTGVIYFYCVLSGDVSYTAFRQFLYLHQQSWYVFGAVITLILPFFYSIGIVPLHIAMEDKLSKSILPVSHYFAIILPLILFGAFIKLNIVLFTAYTDILGKAYLIFALISMVLGAIGANARINLQRIYAYSSFYHFGLVLLLLSLGHNHTDFAGFIYLIAYLLSLNGAYLVFYSLKSHGEYLLSIAGLAGLAETRPYAAGALSVSLFSLIGMPPLIGFLGLLNLSYEMIKAEYFISLSVAFIFLLFLFKAYLGIIKTAFFEHKIRIFDTVNKWVLTYMFLNITIIVLLLFNPFHLIEHLKDMFYVVFL